MTDHAEKLRELALRDYSETLTGVGSFAYPAEQATLLQAAARIAELEGEVKKWAAVAGQGLQTEFIIRQEIEHLRAENERLQEKLREAELCLAQEWGGEQYLNIPKKTEEPRHD